MRLYKEQFADVKVLVVGDVMLDQYWFGSVDRVSPEAPVPVLAVKQTEKRAGGAANVAHNLRALGAQTQLLSIIGDDDAGQDIESLIEAFGAESKCIRDTSIRTIVKLRMMAQNHQLLRVDFDHRPNPESLQACYAAYMESLAETDVVVLSDYGKGSLDHCQQMIEAAIAAGKPVIVDPKGDDYSKYKGASLITPNTREFETVAGKAKNDEEFSQRAFTLRKQLSVESLLVTRSERGMSLFTNDDQQVDSPAQALEVYDVSGAGDTVIAMMALCKAIDAKAQDSLHLANTVAGIVVGKLGTAVATIDEVIEKLETE